MEGHERANVEARIKCLRNIQVLLDAAVMEMQQYSSVVGQLDMTSRMSRPAGKKHDRCAISWNLLLIIDAKISSNCPTQLNLFFITPKLSSNKNLKNQLVTVSIIFPIKYFAFYQQEQLHLHHQWPQRPQWFQVLLRQQYQPQFQMITMSRNLPYLQQKPVPAQK